MWQQGVFKSIFITTMVELNLIFNNLIKKFIIKKIKIKK